MIQIPYHEYAPSALLAPYIQCYWTMTVTQAPPYPVKNLVLPDGCIDIVFEDDSAECELVGAMRKPSIVMLGSPANILGIRFKPAGAAIFFDFPLHELTDAAEALTSFWRDPAKRLLDAIQLKDAAGRIRALEAILIRQLHTAGREHDALIRTAVSLMQTNSYLAVAELANNLNLSERQLERRFQQEVGLTPKLFMRIMRFQRGIKQWREDNTSGALLNEYYDQSHFIRDFKAFSGLTPSEYSAYQQDVGFVQYPDDAS